MEGKKPYTVKGEFKTCKEAEECIRDLEKESHEVGKWIINYDRISGLYEVVDVEEFEKAKKINDWQNDRHIKELRKKMYATDLTEAKIICEVMVNKHPEMYVDTLKEYIHSFYGFLGTFEEVVNEMQEERHFIYTGEES